MVEDQQQFRNLLNRTKNRTIISPFHCKNFNDNKTLLTSTSLSKISDNVRQKPFQDIISLAVQEVTVIIITDMFLHLGKTCFNCTIPRFLQSYGNQRTKPRL